MRLQIANLTQMRFSIEIMDKYSIYKETLRMSKGSRELIKIESKFLI